MATHLWCMDQGVASPARGNEAMAFRSEVTDFGAFYERTYQVAFRTALAIVGDAGLAADVTQEAYVAAYRRRDRFRGEAPAHAWLHRIVVNQALSAVRRHKPIVREIRLAEAMGPDHARSSANHVALFGAIAALPPRYRAAVVLRYYHDYDYATIAHCLGTTTSNVGAVLSRALDRLKAELEPAQVAVAGHRTVNDGH